MKWMLLLPLLIMTTAQAEVPHRFSAGEPARASKVNENFQYLEDRINDSNCPSKTFWEEIGVTRPAYDYIASSPGDSLTINGRTYYIVKLPFMHPITGEIYAITLPVDSESMPSSDTREIRQSLRVTPFSQDIENYCDSYSLSGFKAIISGYQYIDYTFYNSAGVYQNISDNLTTPYVQVAVSGVSVAFSLSGLSIWYSSNNTSLGPTLINDLDFTDLLTTEDYTPQNYAEYAAAIDRLIDYIHVEKISL